MVAAAWAQKAMLQAHESLSSQVASIVNYQVKRYGLKLQLF